MVVHVMHFFGIVNKYLIWLLTATVIVALLCLSYYLLHNIFKKLELKITAKRHAFTNAFIYAVKKPVLFLIAVILIAFAITIFQQLLPQKKLLISWVMTMRNLGVVIAITWTIFRFINRAEYNVINFPSRQKPVNQTTVLALGRLSRIIVFILTILLVLGALHVDVTGILAFGSAGTLVAGISGKDMLANFFGGFMVFMDRPFLVGDLIRSPDKNIEGTVEHIGWRVTTIRTMQKLALYVPNAAFLTISIENESRARNRRIKQVIGLRYGDISKVPAIIADIEAMIAKHVDIDNNQAAYIVMNKFGDSTLDCLLSCFTKTTNMVSFLKVQQDILLKIADIVHQHESDMAFPTTTLDIPTQTLALLSGVKH